jgi:hypothetical protein
MPSKEVLDARKAAQDLKDGKTKAADAATAAAAATATNTPPVSAK